MNNNNDFLRLIQTIEKYNSFAICLPVNPIVDTIAAGTALYLGLIKLGKNTAISSSADISSKFTLNAVDKIQKNLNSGGNNLVVSFPYTDGSIDKVTYNIEGNFFNLIIQPRENQSKIDPSQVKYSYTGGQIDAIFTIDAPTLDSPSLGSLYDINRNQFKGKDIINIDRHVTNSHFGTINLVKKSLSSTSEIIMLILHYAKVEITPDIATNLYIGIKNATNNFTAYSVNAETFENSAFLLKAGAKKLSSFSEPSQNTNLQPPIFEKPPAQSIDNVESKEPQIEEETPVDWLKPKIFKGSNLI